MRSWLVTFGLIAALVASACGGQALPAATATPDATVRATMAAQPVTVDASPSVASPSPVATTSVSASPAVSTSPLPALAPPSPSPLTAVQPSPAPASPSPSPLAQASPTPVVPTGPVIVTARGNFGVRGWAEANPNPLGPPNPGLPRVTGQKWVAVILAATAPPPTGDQPTLDLPADTLNCMTQPVLLVPDVGPRKRCGGQTMGGIVRSVFLVRLMYHVPEESTTFGLAIGEGEPVPLRQVDLMQGE